jgi:hypothetical protein
MEWHGEDEDDTGRIIVKDNVVMVRRNMPPYFGGDVPDVKIEDGEITKEEKDVAMQKYRRMMAK